MNKLTKISLFILCFILIASISSKPVILDDQESSFNHPEMIVHDNNPLPTPRINNGELGSQNDNLDDGLYYEGTIYKQGTYEVGINIPEGVYLATSEGTDTSKMVITSSIEVSIITPKIIITSRYITETGEFTERPNYVEAIRIGGGEPIQPDDDDELYITLKDGLENFADALAERYDGLMLTGGGDIASSFFNQPHHPAANPPDINLDKAELALCRAFREAGKPILGICRGMQILNVEMGGELIQDIPSLLGIPLNVHFGQAARHEISIRRGSWMSYLFDSNIEVNSLHHQSVDIDHLARGFTVVAYTGLVIEAIERGNLLGLQFHPERMLDEGMLQLIEDFIYRCSFNQISIKTFTSHTLVSIKDNQFIDIEGAYLQNIEYTSERFNELYEHDGFYKEGFYSVGTHLPEGNYMIFLDDDVMFSSYMIFDNLLDENPLKTGNKIDNEQLISLKNGQYIKLIHLKMKAV